MWCFIALVFGVAGSVLLAGFLAALDHWCHRRHKPEHGGCRVPVEDTVLRGRVLEPPR